MDIANTCFAKVNDLVSRDIAGESIIVPIRGHVGDLEGVYTLNEVAARIWQLIDGRTSVREILDTVTREYDVGIEEAVKDLLDFFQDLEAAGLIRPSGASKG